MLGLIEAIARVCAVSVAASGSVFTTPVIATTSQYQRECQQTLQLCVERKYDTLTPKWGPYRESVAERRGRALWQCVKERRE